jgi:hypothetical protein
MKNLLIIFFLSSFFFFHSCSNSSQNQVTNSNQPDTAVLIASNDQNLIADTQKSKIEIEGEKEIQAQVEESETKEEIKIQKKEKAASVPQINTSANTDEHIKEVGGEKSKEEKVENSEPEQIEKEEKKIEKVENTKKEESTPTKPTLSHDQWDQLLRKYVSVNGKVNYKGFKSDKANLDAYLKYLNENPVQNSWSKAKKMAYWINAYNAFTIKLIVDNYPVSSITKLHGGKPWDVKWINLGGKTYNLNNIENDILRPTYKDARIHFAVNCAAKSCPPIINQAWTESNLNQLLEKQAKAFVNNSKFNTISSNEVEISKIFEWYAVDFGNIIDYLNKYSTTKINKNAKVKYKEYDWALNE